MVAIRHRDFQQDSIEFQNRDDISERSFVAHNNNDIKLSASFTAAQGALNTAASVHLRNAVAEI